MNLRVECWRVRHVVQAALLLIFVTSTSIYVSRVAVRTSAQSLDKARLAEARDHTRPAASRRPHEPFGTISIPRLKFEAAIREGVEDDTLSVAVGRIPGTSTTAREGNIAFAAHRDTLFRPLRQVRLADEIQLKTSEGTFSYSVTDLLIVKPSDVWVLQPSRRPTLTLVTCYPFNYIGNAPRRFIVKAALVGGDDRKR
jgi:sortase A